MPRFKLHHLFAFSLWISAIGHHPAQAMGVTFTIDPPSPKASDTTNKATLEHPPFAATTGSAAGSPGTQAHPPLPIPPEASNPPLTSTQAKQPLPHNVIASARVLTPPPMEALPSPRVFPPSQSPSGHKRHAIGLSFKSTTPLTTAIAPQPSQPQTSGGEHQTVLPQWIYEGGSNSLVARVIGSAEGTRTPKGQPTRAYYGHTDPGNGVWNMGTFSYQHGAASPNEADDKQLKRLQKQGKNIEQQAKQANLSMSLGEVLNGLDLANQAPRAALERGGYIDRLAQARQKGLNNDNAIIWARTYAYLDPDTQRWNAPGLGNTLPSIQRDQTRRHQAITQAFEHYLAQRDTTGDAPVDSLKTPALAMAPPPTTPPRQANEPAPAKQNKDLLRPAPTIAPVEFTMAEVPSQESQPTATDSPQAQVVPGADTTQIHG